MPKKICFALAFCCLVMNISDHPATAQQGRGQGHGNNNHHGGGRPGGGGNGRHFVDVSPWGVGYSWQNRNFGISVGPAGAALINQAWAGDPYPSPNFGGAVLIPAPVADPWFPGPGIYRGPTPGFDYSQSNFYRPDLAVTAGEVYWQPVPPAAGIPAMETPLTAPGWVPQPVGQDARLLENATAPVHDAGNSFAAAARGLFRAGDYAAAARQSEHALVESPDDALLMLFASQCHFANGDWLMAANRIDAAMVALPEDSWGAVVSSFRDYYGRNDYVAQIQRLEQAALQNGSAKDSGETAGGNALGGSLPAGSNPADSNVAAESWTAALLGYHYHYLGHTDAARRAFETALARNPNDPIASRMLSLTETPPAPGIESPRPAESGRSIPAPLPPGQAEEILPGR